MGFVLHGSQASGSPPYRPSAGRPPRLERVERAVDSDVVCQGAQPGGNHSSVHHAEPQEVLRDPSLSLAEKRDVLRRWALDAYLIELSLSKGEAASEPSRLNEVIDAMLDLEEVKIGGSSRHLAEPIHSESALAA
jgi:hypothetical protein